MIGTTDHRVREALGDLMDAAPEAPAAPATLLRLDDERSRRRPALVAAGIVAAVSVVAVVLVVRSDRTDTRPEPPAPATSTPATTTTLPPVDLAKAAELSQYVGWYLPTYIPAGYEITSLVAVPGRSGWVSNDGSEPPFEHGLKHWLRRTADGRFDASMTVFTRPFPQGNAMEPTPGVTVHGRPAEMSIAAPDEDAAAVAEDGASIIWEEGGVGVSLGASGLSRDMLLAAAEALKVDPVTLAVDLAPGATTAAGSALEGFELQRPDVPAPSNGVDLHLVLKQRSGSADEMSVSVAPNLDSYTLDFLDATMTDRRPDRTDIDGRDALFWSEADGTRASLTWFQDGFRFDVGGGQRDEVVALAEGLRAVQPDQILVEGEKITPRTLTLPIFDEATLADGTRLTIRSQGGESVAALCIEAPIKRCTRQPTVYSDDNPDLFAPMDHVFTIGDEQVLLGWRDRRVTPEFLRRSQPDVGHAQVPDEVVAAGVGQFFKIRIPPGQQPPTGVGTDGVSFGQLVDY